MKEKITISIPAIPFILISVLLFSILIIAMIINMTISEENISYKTVEQARIEVLFKSMTALAKKKALGYPVRTDSVNSDFGMRRNPIRRFIGGMFRGFHSGVDCPATNGQPVSPAADGIVIKIGRAYIGGKYIIIDHDDGVITYYYHLEKIKVRPGELVLRGDVIGYAGDTGITTGPHVHFQVNYNGVPMNPAFWIHRTY